MEDEKNERNGYWKFNPSTEPVYSSEEWYDLTDGGYIKPEELLVDPKQVEELQEAIRIVRNFLDEAIDKNLIILG